MYCQQLRQPLSSRARSATYSNEPVSEHNHDSGEQKLGKDRRDRKENSDRSKNFEQ